MSPHFQPLTLTDLRTLGRNPGLTTGLINMLSSLWNLLLTHASWGSAEPARDEKRREIGSLSSSFQGSLSSCEEDLLFAMSTSEQHNHLTPGFQC